MEEKPWKSKKYAKTKYSRQKLRKEDWVKKASNKEDLVLRYLIFFTRDIDFDQNIDVKKNLDGLTKSFDLSSDDADDDVGVTNNSFRGLLRCLHL